MEDNNSLDDASSPATTTGATTTTTVTSSSCAAASSPSQSPSPPSALLTCAFNQDGGCLAIGTTTGFSVYNLYPHYGMTVNRTLQGGIGLVEMLFRCNLMALVGGGPFPQAAPHRVLIWDDHIPKEIGELSFRQVVLRVRLRKDAIAVALRDRVYVYHLADLSLRDKIYTSDNEHGLLCLSTQIQDMVLACPSVTTGHVRVELYGLRKTVLIEAHESALRGLVLTPNGQKVATASIRGTVIRVWNVATATCSHEFRRGVERANITCLAFSWDYQYLACTSDKGTAHVFRLDNNNGNTQQQQQDGGAEEKKHQESSLSATSTTLTQMFFSTVRRSVEGDAKKSICQIRGVPHPQACAFCSEAAVVGAATSTTTTTTNSSNLLAVAGWDADGNGVLLLSEFGSGSGGTNNTAFSGQAQQQQHEARRVGYHVLCQTTSIPENETEEAKRRRRLRGWAPEVPQTPEGGRLYVGERLEILEKGMEQIQFDEGDEDDDEFVSVTALRPEEVQAAKEQQQQQQQAAAAAAEQQQQQHACHGGDNENNNINNNNPSSSMSPSRQQQEHQSQSQASSAGHAESSSSQLTEEIRSSNLDSGTVGDSVRTEPLGDSETRELETQSP